MDLLLTAYFVFGSGIVLGLYLGDDQGDRPGLAEQGLIIIATVLAWPLILLAVGYQVWRTR